MKRDDEGKIVEGIYEEIINEGLDRRINDLKVDDYHIEMSDIDEGESTYILSAYMENVLRNTLDRIKTDTNVSKIEEKIELVNKLIGVIKSEINLDDDEEYDIQKEARQLDAIYSRKNKMFLIDNTKKARRPETSISKTSLFTGSDSEPQMYIEFKSEIASSNRVDILVSFIKWSGLRVIIDDLRRFTNDGGRLRVITTSYMGATDIKAIDELNKLSNTEIKVTYDTKITRLHAKSYMFYRDNGYTTAYVGSSNMSNAALTSGLEWNVKLTNKDLPETIEKIEATFESYWNSPEFETYLEADRIRLKDALVMEKNNGVYSTINEKRYFLDVRPYSYQQEVLDELEAERKLRNNYKNLIVAATGVGKTVISAFDYKRFRNDNPNKPCRLLFVAHRKEILEQSIETYRAVLKDKNFGELYVGDYKPQDIEHLFISIQTFNSKKFTEYTSKDFYDYIVIDETHHAVAESYKELLEYYNPKILLGLTATPERLDGRHNELYEIFNNNITSEIRLPEAINRKLLCPFQYFGITDEVDLDDVKWVKGGYDKKELSILYLSDKVAQKRVEHIVKSIDRYVTDIDEVKGIGFCVSIEHAEFMAREFNKRGIPSISLTSNSEKGEIDRESAKESLKSGKIKFIFTVDLYNEGVDIKFINTVLFLRPTESLTIFLQQLGRGLRLHESKDYLTVLDFIGHSNKNYSFEDKFKSLLDDRDANLEKEIKAGFSNLPKGCYIQLEKKATEYVLENIKYSLSNKKGLIEKIKRLNDEEEVTLKRFLERYNLDPQKIYKINKINFSRLCVEAGILKDFDEDIEDVITKSFFKLCYINSIKWIDFLLSILKDKKRRKQIDEEEKIMLKMFNYTIWQDKYSEKFSEDLFYGINEIDKTKIIKDEIISLLEYQRNKIDFIDKKIALNFKCPLDIHCSYTKDQVLTAIGHKNPKSMREGVYYSEDKKVDILFVTLNKSDKDYSPTTMYKDYSVNNTLFHWQSQSTTSDMSKTGKRYINHKKMGNEILLFVRENKKHKINNKADAYVFLGKVDYVSHSGSRPMNIMYRLEEKIPAKFMKKTNKLKLG